MENKQRPVAYYSSKLDAVPQAMPPCLQAVEGASMALNQALPLTGAQDVNIVVPHVVLAILSGKKSLAVHVARWTQWETSLLMPSVHLQEVSSLNPATLIPSPDEGHPHHCCLKEEPMDFPLVKETEIPDAPCLYVDGSSFYVNGKRHTGWAICTQDGQLVAHGSLPGASAQVAKLQALIAVYETAEGHAISIYTDSRYTFGVVHDYLNLWVNRGFLTSTGSAIQNGGIVQKLHAAMQKPTEVAVIKVRAHTKGTDPHSKGNQRAEELAKQAAVESKETQLIAATQPLIKTPNFFELEDIQHAAPRAEKWLWMDNGGKLCDDNT
ncbi:uncharacterized protein LOC115656858 isoform X2 [Gopherus evgoodei]|uniref:uncharacterized protein LOC115656858 isoform X2 n=1 Tax=Gopherus evgoodei TaxID=1825980 RepID=UPI0011CF4741|nr:uncharacterized protein LOC115656858 isoform X2 [Gopherus evgoodei]